MALGATLTAVDPCHAHSQSSFRTLSHSNSRRKPASTVERPISRHKGRNRPHRKRVEPRWTIRASGIGRAVQGPSGLHFAVAGRHAGRRYRHKAWMTTSIDVSVDGNHVLTTGALTSISGICQRTFTYEGYSHAALLKWGGRSFRSIPYTLEIDGSLVETSRVHVSNWWARYWPLAAGLAIGALAYVLQR